MLRGVGSGLIEGDKDGSHVIAADAFLSVGGD
jgi:hypothetical protein